MEEVNKSGDPKTVKQCKDKIRNLKKKYKEAKANNNKPGRPPQTSPFYNSSILLINRSSFSSTPAHGKKPLNFQQVNRHLASDFLSTIQYQDTDSDCYNRLVAS